MRLLWSFLIASSIMACSTKADITETSPAGNAELQAVKKVDTTSVAPITQEEPAKENTKPFNFPFTANLSGPDIFPSHNYDTLKALAEGMGIEFEQAYLAESGGILSSEVLFVNFTVWEDKSHDLCVASVTKNGFPLKHGLKIGMPMSECLQLLNIKYDTLTGDSETGEGLYHYSWINGGGDYGQMIFRFDDQNTILKGLEYRAPCANGY